MWGSPAGLGCDTLPTARALYLPLVASGRAVGVLGIAPAPSARFLREERPLLDTFVSQAAGALDRASQATHAERARLHSESEYLRNTLFSSVSRDLKAPLAALADAAEELQKQRGGLSLAQLRLADTISRQAGQLGRQLAGLLERTRLESGWLRLRREWRPIGEVIDSSLHQLPPELAGRPVSLHAPGDLPLAAVDSVLMERALANLFENAMTRDGSGSPIDVTARPLGSDGILIEVATPGSGVSDPADLASLGLTICREIVEAHAGRVTAENRPGGGALYRVQLPVMGDAGGHA